MSSETQAVQGDIHRAWARLSPQALATAMIAAGLAAMFAPVFYKLWQTVWSTDEQGHGPLIVGVVLWLIWQRRGLLEEATRNPVVGGTGSWALLALGLLTYFVGRLQNIALFEMGSLLLILPGALAAVFGWRVVRIMSFPIFFLIFAIPLPGQVVDALTSPLKHAVSWVAEQILYAAGYPISRTGVILMVGPYQLLVADACAGLNSMFTLEALGLLYMNIIGHTSRLRNVILAILIVPMSFVANVIRVMVLVLVTFHFGDEAGQGFVHSAAGMLLFIVGLSLMIAMDSALGVFFREGSKA